MSFSVTFSKNPQVGLRSLLSDSMEKIRAELTTVAEEKKMTQDEVTLFAKEIKQAIAEMKTKSATPPWSKLVMDITLNTGQDNS